MKVVYAQEKIESSIFLAGPTPRDPITPSWRPEVLGILARHNFNGTVYVPETREYVDKWDYEAQIEWEWKSIASSTVILFWIPRSDVMPGYTTNVEFGLMVASGKVLLGHPPKAPKMRYLEELGIRYNVPCYHDLVDLVKAAILKAQE
jgi:hypothetical protein